MRSLKEELEINFTAFNHELKRRLNETFDALELNNQLYIGSYERLSSFEAWRAYVIEQKVSSSSLSFFLEAQNDALLSHAFAKIGSWRAALQSLRSVIENTLFCLYYMDHPVEYQLWEAGKNQLPISDYVKYISKHPKFYQIDDNITGAALLKREYSILSKAVHASATSFRMTGVLQHFPTLMLPDILKLNQWLTRERHTIQIVNQILITIFFEELQGAKLRNLRKSISFTIPKNLFEQIRNQFNIRLFELPDIN